MRRTIAILIFIAILALGAHAQRANDLEPYSVKGDKLGETAAEWLASDPAHKNWACGEALHLADGKTADCTTLGWAFDKGTYAEVLLASESVFFVARGHKLILYKVEMNLWNDMYLPRIMTALRDKFGTPAAHEVTSLQNTDGAALDRSMWRWTNGLSSVELVYALGAPNDVPALTFTLDSPSEEVEKREDKKKDDAARNDM
ncbi:MAG: hypothetical protein ABR874_05785 [Candidatus Sulfotelmatobacter sp.]|jgi:hypothetical protein